MTYGIACWIPARFARGDRISDELRGDAVVRQADPRRSDSEGPQ
jgi:hypothetical protein